ASRPAEPGEARNRGPEPGDVRSGEGGSRAAGAAQVSDGVPPAESRGNRHDGRRDRGVFPPGRGLSEGGGRGGGGGAHRRRRLVGARNQAALSTSQRHGPPDAHGHHGRA
ncbi:unnamed protein product, partial [Ectocarpus sp. 8 AP-2014]